MLVYFAWAGERTVRECTGPGWDFAVRMPDNWREIIAPLAIGSDLRLLVDVDDVSRFM